jgi:hypothetical protein
MYKHIFLINYKDKSQKFIILEMGNNELYFKTFYDILTDDKIESYYLFNGSNVTNEKNDNVLKCCKRFLGID